MKRPVRIAPVTLVALLALAVVAVALAGCGSKDITPPINDINKARDVSAKSEIMMVKTGIAGYIATNTALPASATQDVLGSLVNPWPTNPWTQAPMAPGSQPGDIVYTPGAGVSYTLGVHLSDGSVFTAP
jgi:hypothetical protein